MNSQTEITLYKELFNYVILVYKCSFRVREKL